MKKNLISKITNKKGKSPDIAMIVMLAIIVIAIVVGVVIANKDKGKDTTNDTTKPTIDTSVTPPEDYEVEVYDYTSKVTLPDYKDFPISYYPYEMTEDEYLYYVDYYKDMVRDYEDVTTGTLQDGDVSVITYNGWLKENTAKKGETQEYNPNMTTTTPVELTLGQNQYIDGFEEGLVGKKIGDTVKLNLKFPEEYGDEAYNGKDAIFEVTIVAKRVFTDEVSNEKVKEVLVPMFFQNPEEATFSNFEEFKVFLKADMEKYYKNSEEQNKENSAIDGYIAAVTDIEYSEEDIAKVRKDIETKINEEIAASGVEKEEFATNYYGIQATEDKSAYDLLIEQSIDEKLKYEVVMYNLAKQEGIEVDDETIEEYVQHLANFYGVDKEEIKSAYYYEVDGEVHDHMADLRAETLSWKVSQFLIENVKFEKIEMTDNLESLESLDGVETLEETSEEVVVEAEEEHDHEH